MPTHAPTSAPKADVWNDALLVDPHSVADKRTRVQTMFAAIAPSYDLNNRLHSLWIDQHWRKSAVKLAKLRGGDRVMDVACGTGDLTMRFARALAKLNRNAEGEHSAAKAIAPVVGVDFTYEMLPLAIAKSARSAARAIYFNGDAQALPISNDSCDVVSIAFGIRNVADPSIALAEFVRVLRPGGRVVILEFSLPRNRLIRCIYNFYFHQILPRTCTWISRDTSGAYKYLPQSVNTFISREKMVEMMESAGLKNIRQHPMTFGVAVAYVGHKS